jgi:hypothetical protein
MECDIEEISQNSWHSILCSSPTWEFIFGTRIRCEKVRKYYFSHCVVHSLIIPAKGNSVGPSFFHDTQIASLPINEENI